MEQNENVETVETETTTEPTEIKTQESTEESLDFKAIKKDLSKKLGLNLFDDNNKVNDEILTGLKSLIDSQKSKEELEAEKQQEMLDQLEAYKAKEADWDFKEAAYELDLDMAKSDDIKILLNAKKQEGQSTSEVLQGIVEQYPMFKNDVVVDQPETKRVNHLGMNLNSQQVKKPSGLQQLHDEKYGDSPYYKSNK